jgi:hypothetical protein
MGDVERGAYRAGLTLSRRQRKKAGGISQCEISAGLYGI